MTTSSETKHLVVTEFEMGVGASLLDSLRISKTQKEFMKYKVQLKQLLRSLFSVKMDRIPRFNLISVAKVTDVQEFPGEVNYVFYYEEIQ